MQLNNASRPFRSIFLTREKSTITCGFGALIFFFNSRPSFRAALAPNTSGSLTMIVDNLSMYSSLITTHIDAVCGALLLSIYYRCELLTTGLRTMNSQFAAWLSPHNRDPRPANRGAEF